MEARPEGAPDDGGPDAIDDADPGATAAYAAERRAVLRQSLSVGLATSAYGVSFGALAVASGLDLWQTCACRCCSSAGGRSSPSSAILGAGGSGLAAVATSSLLGVRNGLYGLQVAATLRSTGWRRLVAAHLTIDESTAVSIGQTTPRGRRLGFWVTGAVVFAGWNLTTLLGAVLGNALGDPRTYGFDAAAAAAFLALLWPRLRSLEAGAVGAAAAVLAAVFTPLTPPGVPVLVAAVAALAVGLRRRPGDEGPHSEPTAPARGPT